MDKNHKKQYSRKNRLNQPLREILQDFADWDIDIEEAIRRIEGLNNGDTYEEGEVMNDQLEVNIKSIISDCICKTLTFHKVKTTEDVLNLLSNEYVDKIITYLKSHLEK